MSKTNITDAHKQAFDRIRQAPADEVCLYSCFVNDVPTSAICDIYVDPEGMHVIKPLFIAVTPAMKLTNHDGEEA